MSNVFQSLKPKASLSRNGFDLSQRHLFSSKAGMIVPVMCLDCIPNDFHEINLSSLVRTMPLATDAFARMRIRYCFGFVPYWQVWHPWNEFITQTKENQSNLEPENLQTEVPMIGLSDLLSDIANSAYIAGDRREPDEFGQYPAFNAVRLLDMLGYGAYYDIAEAAYKAGTDADQSKLADIQDWIENEFQEKSVNPFRIASYHKFYNDYFRNPVWENADPNLYNCDNLSGGSYVTRTQARNMFYTMQYSYYSKDMFTGLYPTPQFGAVSSIDIVDKQIKNKMPTSSLSNAKIGGSGTATSGLLRSENTSTGYDKWSITAAFDVYDLKRAEALQAWKETKLRAGSKVKDQATAFWGSPFRYAMDNYCQWVDEVDLNLSIDEVMSTAATEQANLGQIGGKGIGVSSGNIKFKTDDFGTLICVAIVEPIGEYNALMIDKNNTLCEPFDFATPQFENLGFESVSQYQLSLYGYIGDDTAIETNTVLGYAPRYLNYKTAVDKCHGEFMRVGHYGHDDIQGDVAVSGSLAHWCCPRTEMQMRTLKDPGVALNDLKISPKIVDNIFYIATDGLPSSDQFIFNCNFDIKSVRSLSVLGLPRWS